MATDGSTNDGGLETLCQKAISASFSQASTIKQCDLETVDAGLVVHVVYTPLCLGGRCPAGLEAPEGTGARPSVGDWLARSAHFEAASVDAFLVLARELEAHRAPGLLVLASRASAQDERRHARLVGHLARARRARPPTVRVARQPTRAVEAIARENAVEGCVRETFAALVAYRQAREANDPDIRRAMRGIARDEIRHASLSWSVHDWIHGSLSLSARRRTREALAEEGEVLMREVVASVPGDLCEQAGLPDADESLRIVAALLSSLR